MGRNKTRNVRTYDPVPGARSETGVFLDTGVLYALRVKRDDLHGAATAVLSELTRLRTPLVLSYPVVLDAYRLLLYKEGIAAAHGFLRGFRQLFNLEIPTSDDMEQAEAYVLKYHDVEVSLTDSVNAAMAKRFKARVCCHDRHYDYLDVEVIRVA